MHSPLLVTATVVVLLVAPAAGGQDRDERGPDPSGTWQSRIGTLTMLRTGDALSLTYSAVFGASAHTCDVAGIAGFVGKGRFDLVDEQGTVSITVGDGTVTLAAAAGIPSFCGAGWPGDSFGKDAHEPPVARKVTAPKAHFHVVGSSPPVKRRAYVVKGDRVEVVGVEATGLSGWVLARYTGKTATTVGLLEKLVLEGPLP